MYLRTFVDLPMDFDDVRASLLGGLPPSCLTGAAEVAERECVDLLDAAGLSAGGRVASWPSAVEAESPVATDRLASLPLFLYAGRALLTQLATLDAGWLGAGRTHLSLSMSYDSRLDEVGDIAELRDRALVHRVHEAVARRFLDAVAERMLEAVPA